MEGRCTGCGACCNPVTLPRGAKMRARGTLAAQPDHEDALWIRNLIPLPRREAVRRLGRPMGAKTDGFECPNFEPTTRMCLSYETRPPVCRNYPFYGADPETYDWENSGIPAPCGFRPENHE